MTTNRPSTGYELQPNQAPALMQKAQSAIKVAAPKRTTQPNK